MTEKTGLISLSLCNLQVNAFYLVACFSTSATAAHKPQVVEVSAAVLHGGRGIAQLRAAIVFVARHHGHHHAVWHVVAQRHNLTHVTVQVMSPSHFETSGKYMLTFDTAGWASDNLEVKITKYFISC